MQLCEIKARLIRLEELAHGLAKEVNAWKMREGPQPPPKRKCNVDAPQDALAGLDEASVVLAGVVKRLQKGPG